MIGNHKKYDRVVAIIDFVRTVDKKNRAVSFDNN